MRSIAVKLTLAFLLIGLTGSILVAVVLRQRIRTAFDEFILTRDQQILVDTMLRYYQNRGSSWAGIEARVDNLIENSPANQFRSRRELPRFTLVNANRQIISSPRDNEIGKQVSQRELDRGVPLVVDGNTIGWLLWGPEPREWIPDSPEAIFLANINRGALFSALIATALAVIMGGVLAYTMTSSLRELTDATVEIARGKLGKQVKVRSKDEIGELAASFNQMSLDLAQATQARRQMTADIAHDLRSPLSVISGYAEALSDGKLPGTPEVYNILHQETQQLSHLVEDLRTLSLADAGELQLNRVPVAPQTLLERAAARQKLSLKDKEINLTIEGDAGLEPLLVDPDRMAQVFDNLLSNAIRYTQKGGKIWLSARRVNGHIELQVGDNGSGIAPEALPHIFDRFYRGDKARQANGQSGLGLAISKSIVEMHGGTIRVTSQPGNGTVFTITI